MACRTERERGKAADIVAGHAESGLSVAAYCRRRNIPLSSFYFMRRKVQASRSVTMHGGGNKRGGFVPVEIKPDGRADGPSAVLTVTFPGGMVVRTPGTPELMREICDSLLRAEGLA